MSAIDDASTKFIADAELVHQIVHGVGSIDIGEGQTRPSFEKIAVDFNAENAVDVANKANKDGGNAIGIWPIEAARVTSVTEAQVLSAIGMTPISVDEIGANGGVCELDQNGFVPSARLPSSVDEVIEVATFANLPATGLASKIYLVITDTDGKTNQYRWGGTVYVKLTPSPGTTDDVVEGTAKYFTNARALATVLAGLSMTDGSAVTAADTIIASIGKLQKQINNIPYDIASAVVGKPEAGEVGPAHTVGRSFILPAGLTGSVAHADISPTAAVVISLVKGDVQFGTITFAIGSQTGVFAAASATTFASGSILRAIAPASQDATFSGLSYTLAGLLTS